MANTGIVYGGDIQLYRNTGTEVSPVWAAFAHATSHSYKGSTALREVTSKDTGGDTWVKPGKHSPSTISISGLVTYDGSDFYVIEAFRLARTKLQVKYSGRPAADTLYIDVKEASADKYLSGYGYITECSREDAADGDATYSVSITMSAKPTISAVV
jgi:hypothetical protein